MTKKERIQAAIRGEKPDKMPYSFWTHMPGTDLDPEAISQKTYEFYKKYDFDFVKTMNNGMYAIEDFGCTVDYSEIVKGRRGQGGEHPHLLRRRLAEADGLPLHPGQQRPGAAPSAAGPGEAEGRGGPRHLHRLHPHHHRRQDQRGKLISYIEEGHGDDVKAALEVITETTAQLVAAAHRPWGPTGSSWPPR